jgi:hypothetical protein
MTKKIFLPEIYTTELSVLLNPDIRYIQNKKYVQHTHIYTCVLRTECALIVPMRLD